MPVPTVTVIARLSQIVGTPMPGARIVYNLARADIVPGTDGGIVPAGQVIAVVDNEGNDAETDLFPNELGTNTTQYGVQIYNRDGVQVFPERQGSFALTTIPNVDPVLLHSIIYNVPTMTKAEGDAYLQAAALAAARAEAAEDGAREAQDNAAQSSGEATTQADRAQTQADRAEQEADLAEAQVPLVQAEGNTQVARLGTEGDAQIVRVTGEGNTQDARVIAEGDTQVARVISEVAPHVTAAQNAATTATAAASSAQADAITVGNAVGSATAISNALPPLGRVSATWATVGSVPGLSTITAGITTGTRGEVTSDTGTHTDPVTALTVPNTGIFMFVSPTGWTYTGPSDVTALKTAGYRLADEVEVPEDDGIYKIAGTADDLDLGINIATGELVGDSIDKLGLRPFGNFYTQRKRVLALKPTPFLNGEGWNFSTQWGQSNSLGSGDGAPVLTTVQLFNNITFNGGVRADGSGAKPWTATKPLVEEIEGINSESSCSGNTEMANVLALRDYGVLPQNYITFAAIAAQGATAIDGLDKPSTVYSLMVNQWAAAVPLAAAAGKQLIVTDVCCEQGETDGVNQVTRVSYATKKIQLAVDINADARATTGQTSDVHLIVAQCSYYVTNAVDKNVALAQLDAEAADPQRIHNVYPTSCLGHDEDDTHRTPIYHKVEGARQGRARNQLLIEGRKPDRLKVAACYALGRKVHVVFEDVPKPPLRFHFDPLAGGMTAVQDMGLKVTDALGTLTISGMRITAWNRISFDVNRDIDNNPRLRVGLDYLPWDMEPAGKGITNGAVTNICDSTKDVIVIDGITYELPHWCLHDEMPVIKLPYA